MSDCPIHTGWEPLPDRCTHCDKKADNDHHDLYARAVMLARAAMWRGHTNECRDAISDGFSCVCEYRIAKEVLGG